MVQFKIKLKVKEVQILWSAMHVCLPDGNDTEYLLGLHPHRHLLYEHTMSFIDKFGTLADKVGKHVTVKFSSLECLAFCQIWADTQTGHPYSQLLVQKVADGIDKHRKNQKLITSPQKLIGQ